MVRGNIVSALLNTVVVMNAIITRNIIIWWICLTTLFLFDLYF